VFWLQRNLWLAVRGLLYIQHYCSNVIVAHPRLAMSHRKPPQIFGFHVKEEIGPKMLAKIAKNTGLEPEDL